MKDIIIFILLSGIIYLSIESYRAPKQAVGYDFRGGPGKFIVCSNYVTINADADYLK